jgi:glutathione S-transferase
VLKFFVDLGVAPGFVRLERYGKVKAWWERCEGREGWKRALEKGNGYDLDFLGKWWAREDERERRMV